MHPESPKELVKPFKEECGKHPDEATTWMSSVYGRMKAAKLSKELASIETVQRPGEVIFVPSGKKEYKEIMDRFYSSNLTRQQLDDELERWAKKQGQSVQIPYEKCVDEQDRFEAKRYHVLSERINATSASEDVKRILISILDQQQWKNLTADEYGEIASNVEKSYPENVRVEADDVWNSINPTNLN
ncbi:unnamed protein product [Toxocara canis]|uniref:DUF148 domain-containing protein n=1 Tax=Toxocara canis TaxID=6265 RepID=A0A183TWR1_TOXCA|nr:unnamed protein product [Toxocara canis]